MPPNYQHHQIHSQRQAMVGLETASNFSGEKTKRQYRKVQTHPTFILEQLQSGLTLQTEAWTYASMWFSFCRMKDFGAWVLYSKTRQKKRIHTGLCSAYWLKLSMKQHKEPFSPLLLHFHITDDICVQFWPLCYQINHCHALDPLYSEIFERQNESGSSKARELFVHSHIIIGTFWASLFWLQAVQRLCQIFHNGSAK